MKLHIVQLGLGGVGQALVRQYLDLAERYPQVKYIGFLIARGCAWFETAGRPKTCKALCGLRARGEHWSSSLSGRRTCLVCGCVPGRIAPDDGIEAVF